ncbi:MAG: LPS export ABC transporter periplasmic protein LptC [Bacteroidales bacterium]|nr:LPS export ABC transporter periplasmic protein LptC [Bacteroidales bacterium]
MLPCLLLQLILLTSCRNDMDRILFFDRADMPLQTLENVRALRSSNGRSQMLITAPSVVMYGKPEKKTVYPSGFEMRILESNDKQVANIRANYAVSFEEKNTIEARDNVVVIDFRTGDTSYLQSLVWNSAQHRIFSTDSVKSVNGQRVTYGDGFESDDEFTSPQILHQRGTMTIDE